MPQIDNATPAQLDYAVAVAQGFEARITGGACVIKRGFYSIEEVYAPATDQAQCGELIDTFGIATKPKLSKNKIWIAESIGWWEVEHESRLIAAVKAFLWSKYPDGLIEVQDDK